ncbi:MAG: DUF6825 family protein [Chroococcales cyanobacterium]
MSNPVIHAFFVGRAVAEVVGEKFEDALTNALSDLGKFDAEQRENLRQFTEEVMIRAEREAANYQRSGTPSDTVSSPSGDLQETIDELRAEMARIRTDLQSYRNPTP